MLKKIIIYIDFKDGKKELMDEDFTGMILLPGSFSGSISSPRPHRGPLHQK